MSAEASTQQECRHAWIANSGDGGDPEFRPAAIVAGDTPVMHVRCAECGCRTWFSRSQWAALPVQGESRAARRRRMRDAEKIAQQEERRRQRLTAERRREHERTGETWWNGEKAACRRVVVRVGAVERPTWWCAGMEGTERRAVEVRYAGQVFYLDDESGRGWDKVTVGRGSPGYGHLSLPDDSVVVREVGRG